MFQMRLLEYSVQQDRELDQEDQLNMDKGGWEDRSNAMIITFRNYPAFPPGHSKSQRRWNLFSILLL